MPGQTRKTISAQNAVALVTGPRPLDGGRALLDVGKDSIDEILASPIAEVLNDERADRTPTAKWRTVREVMYATRGETGCDRARILFPTGFEISTDHLLHLLLNRIHRCLPYLVKGCASSPCRCSDSYSLWTA